MQLQKYQTNAYTKISVETANPGTILLTLYDAAIRFVRTAKANIEAGDIASKGVNIAKAHRIIAEFINALDFNASYELCTNLERIYGFMIEQLSEANTNVDPAPLEPVLLHLQELRDTWAKAVEQSGNESPKQQTQATG